MELIITNKQILMLILSLLIIVYLVRIVFISIRESRTPMQINRSITLNELFIYNKRVTKEEYWMLVTNMTSEELSMFIEAGALVRDEHDRLTFAKRDRKLIKRVMQRVQKQQQLIERKIKEAGGG